MTAEEWLIAASRVARMERDLFHRPPTVESIRALLMRRGWVPVTADVLVFEGLRLDMTTSLPVLLRELRRCIKI